MNCSFVYELAHLVVVGAINATQLLAVDSVGKLHSNELFARLTDRNNSKTVTC